MCKGQSIPIISFLDIDSFTFQWSKGTVSSYRWDQQVKKNLKQSPEKNIGFSFIGSDFNI